MKERLLEWLACPGCGSSLELGPGANRQDDEIRDGELKCRECSLSAPIRAFIPRFVDSDNYAANFGLQWQRFSTTQIDSCNGNSISRDRFLATTGWDSLARKVILDGGCGTGRFAEIALDLGAEVIALDYSEAADVCWANLRRFGSRIHVIQANLLKLPVKRDALGGAYSMGVLQHTPDPERAFAQLASVVRPGGTVVADSYGRSKLRYLNSIYWYRPLLKHIPPRILFPLVERAVRLLHPIKHRLMTASVGNPLLAVGTSMVIPINSHWYQFPFLSEKIAVEWAILNTFDAYSPRYDQPQSPDSMRRWAEHLGLRDIEVFCKPGHGDGTALVCRGVKA